MPELREVFEVTTKQMGEPDLDSWREQEERQRKANRNKKIGAFALAAAIVVVAVVVIVGTRGSQDSTTPADQPTVNPPGKTAEDIAMDFLHAWASFNADEAVSYLAGAADISGFGVEDPREFRLLIAFDEATGLEVIPASCEETGTSPSSTYLRCAFDFHGIRSEEIGRGPYGGSYIDITVGNGQIIRAAPFLDIRKFGPQMWDPFAEWVSTNYPKDVAAMYVGDFSDYRLTPESIRLWEQHSREYVQAVKQGTA
jgi:hypothetical protein